MKVLLVESHYGHPFPHLFTLKAITFWESQGAKVLSTKGSGIEIEPSFDPDLIQVTTPIFSWGVPNSIETIKYFQFRFPKAKIEIGGVMATLHSDYFEQHTGIKPFQGVHHGIMNSRPAWDRFPNEKLCRVQITAGCAVGCDFCLVTPMYGKASYEVMDWQNHFVNRDWIHVIDDNMSQSIMTIKGLGDRLLEFFGDFKPKSGFFDLNSGVEPRSFNDKVAEVMMKLPIHPWRTALDDISETEYTLKAIDIMIQHGIKPDAIHVYLLYGNKDDLSDAMYRLNALLERGVTPFAMRYVPLNWFEDKLTYRPPLWNALHYIDFARYVNQIKRRGLHSYKRWPFKWFLENCPSHDHSNDPLLKGEMGV